MSKKKRLHRIARKLNQVTQGVEILTHQLRQLNQRSLIQGKLNLRPEEFPYVQEVVTDTQGQVCKVVLHIEDYQQLLAGLKSEVPNHQTAPAGKTIH